MTEPESESFGDIEYLNAAKWASLLAGFAAVMAANGGYLSSFDQGLIALGFAIAGSIVLGVEYI